MKRTLALVIAVTVLAFVLIVPSSHASMPMIKGKVYWYDQYGNLRVLAWAQVTAEAEDGVLTVASTTTDGSYVMWVPPGNYNVTVGVDGFISQTKMVAVPDGGIVGGVDFQLEPSGEPIPEYPPAAAPLVLALVVIAAVGMIRRHRIRIATSK